MDGEGCFKNLLWPIGEWQKVSTSSLPIRVAMVALGRHGSLQRTLSQILNTTGLYNDYTFHSMLQAQEIRLRSPDRLSREGVWSGHETKPVGTLKRKQFHLVWVLGGGDHCREVGRRSSLILLTA